MAPPPGMVSAPPQQGGGWLIPLGYFFSVAGGLLGIAIGGALWQSKDKDARGEKVSKYNASTRRHGIAMLVLGGIGFAVSGQVVDQIGNFRGGSTADPPSLYTPAPGSEGGGEEGASRPSGGGNEGVQTERPSRPSGGGGASSLADLGLSPNANAGNDYEELVLSYLVEAYRLNLQEEGFGSAIHRQLGSLSEGQSEDLSIRLPAGSDIAIFGTCDNECSDLNFMLFSDEGRLLDDDTTDDDIPLVVHETGGSADRYTLRVEMVSCSIAPCYYALGVYRR